MTVEERRQAFVKNFSESPITLLQGSVGERIKRNFTHRDPAKPLKLAGLYYSREGRRGLETAFRDYVQIAREYRLPLVLHPYASALSGAQLAGTGAEGHDVSMDNYTHCRAIADEHPDIRDKVFVGCSLSFSGNAYRPETSLPEEEAYAHHTKLAQILEKMPIDHSRSGLNSALGEAAGAARALADTSLPYIISFLVRKDGKLLDGTWLNDAIEYIEEKTQKHPPLFYQVNCVHPRNMLLCLEQPQNQTELVRTRFLGLEGNGSDLSPEELDESPVVYTSPADEWADDMMKLYEKYRFKLLGGCCGTDHAHLEELARRIRAVWDKEGK